MGFALLSRLAKAHSRLVYWDRNDLSSTSDGRSLPGPQARRHRPMLHPYCPGWWLKKIRGKIKLGNGSSCRYTRIQARNASARERAGRKSSIIGSGRSVTPEILGRGGVVTANQMPARCRLFCPMEEFIGRRGPGVWQEKPRPAHSHSWRLMPSYLPSGLSVQCSVGRPGC